MKTRDLDKIRDILDENVVFRPAENVPGLGGDWVGLDGFEKMLAAYSDTWHSPENLEIEYLDGGDSDKVVVIVTFDRTSRATGRSIPIWMAEVVTVRGGKITELVPFWHDTVPMVEAVRPIEAI